MTNDSELHLDELTVLRLTDGELSDDRSESARRHLISCARCRSGYEALRAESALIRASVSENDEALPEHIRPRQQDVSWLLIAGLALGTLGLSTAWTRYVTPILASLRTVGLDGETSGELLQTFLPRSWSGILSTVLDGLLVLALVGAGGYVLLRLWRWARATTGPLTCIVAAVVGAVALASDGSAAVIEVDAGGYRLEDGVRIDNDLIVSGTHIVIAGTIAGDLMVAAASVEISGEVEGDVLGVASSIIVTGSVGGNLRAVARSIDIRGRVARNISAGGESVFVRTGALLGGSVIAAGREVTIEAPVDRDIIVGAESATFDSRVRGSVLVVGDRMSLGPESSIGGRARFYGGSEPRVHPDANLESPLEFEKLEDDSPRSAVGLVTRFLYFWGAAFLFGAVVMLLAPEASEEIVTRNVPELGKSLLVGALAAPLTLGFSVVVLVTIVGLPIGLLGFTFLSFGLYVAQAFVAAYIGREFMGTPSTASQVLVRLGLGLLFIHAVKSLPYVTALVTLLIALWGFGAIVLWLRDRSRMKAPASPLGEST